METSDVGEMVALGSACESMLGVSWSQTGAAEVNCSLIVHNFKRLFFDVHVLLKFVEYYTWLNPSVIPS